MSLKAKLATTIAALCMVICLLTVGVWAAQSATVTLKGKVSFVADDVYVKVLGKAEGSEEADKNMVPEAEIAAFNADSATDNSDWAPSLTFSKKGETITVTITVQNLSTEREVELTFAPTIAGTAIPVNKDGDEKTVTAGNVTAYATAAAKVAKATSADAPGTATCTIVLTIANRNQSFENVELGGKLTMSNVKNTTGA